jgi:hypothetical protein
MGMSEAKIKVIVEKIFTARKLKLVQPEGYFDALGRWFPSHRENATDGMMVKAPTAKSRYSFRIHCRSKAHVRTLVGLALAGHDVPPDVADAIGAQTEKPHAKPSVPLAGVTKSELPGLVSEFLAFVEGRGNVSRGANS